MRVLDVGSNAGYDPFMFNLRGPEYVLACEPFAFIEQVRFLESIYQTGVDLQPIGWQQLSPERSASPTWSTAMACSTTSATPLACSNAFTR